MINIKAKKRMRTMLFILIGIMFALIIRLGILQILQGKKLSTLAYEQQTLDRKITPKRGTIYDASGTEIFAVSSTVQKVTVNPVNISKENKEKVAKKLSEIFEVDYDTVYKKVTKRIAIETIAKKVSKEKTDELRIWMKQQGITTGINIDEDTKRYYPNNNTASQIIGFCGSDNQGLDGIEAWYDQTLNGESGAIEKVTDSKGTEIGSEGEEYIPAINGDDIVLTVDLTIQSIAEKYLEEACIDNECTDGGNVVIMNPQNGDILAMATYPTYNLNEPFMPYTDELIQNWDIMSQEEKSISLQGVWRNKAVADTYEPGSTFKLITASSALEEEITDTDNEGEFNCNGGIDIAGVRIKCWRYYRPHGSESLRQALMNSCNPVFIGLGQKIGISKYYDYLEKFKLLKKTGIDLPGEANSIFLDEKKVGPVELATISFGQRFEVTPIQLVTAISTIANGGKSVTPRVVKETIDSTTGEHIIMEPKIGEQVISKETSSKVLNMMESVVSEGTGKGARVLGYSIGGKTGTSEDGVNTNKYIASFMGVASIEEPEVVMLVTLYNPTGEGGHQGGGIAAPVAGKIFSELLPYLEVVKYKIDEIEVKEQVAVPNITGININEAEKILKEQNLILEYEETEEIDKENIIIKTQIPECGIKINEGNKVIVKY